MFAVLTWKNKEEYWKGEDDFALLQEETELLRRDKQQSKLKVQILGLILDVHRILGILIILIFKYQYIYQYIHRLKLFNLISRFADQKKFFLSKHVLFFYVYAESLFIRL